MAFRSKKAAVTVRPRDEQSGAWYADPFGTAARRWYDEVSGWSDHVEEAGHSPDKTGLARIDEAATAIEGATRPVDASGKPLPLSRAVDPKYMATGRPVR